MLTGFILIAGLLMYKFKIFDKYELIFYGLIYIAFILEYFFSTQI